MTDDVRDLLSRVAYLFEKDGRVAEVFEDATGCADGSAYSGVAVNDLRVYVTARRITDGGFAGRWHVSIVSFLTGLCSHARTDTAVRRLYETIKMDEENIRLCTEQFIGNLRRTAEIREIQERARMVGFEPVINIRVNGNGGTTVFNGFRLKADSVEFDGPLTDQMVQRMAAISDVLRRHMEYFAREFSGRVIRPDGGQ